MYRPINQQYRSPARWPVTDPPAEMIDARLAQRGRMLRGRQTAYRPERAPKHGTHTYKAYSAKVRFLFHLGECPRRRSVQPAAH